MKNKVEIYIIYSNDSHYDEGENMGSFLMHIGISEIVRKRLNLSIKFIYGSIMPDLVKMKTGDRIGTHFLKTVVTDKGRQRLPDIDNAISLLKGKMDKEIRLGYLAHLVEDLIWFEKYIPSFAERVENGRMVYLKDNSIHLEEEFSTDIYEDYTKINSYVIDKYCKEYSDLKLELQSIMTKQEMEFLEKNDKIIELEQIETLSVISKESLDEYIKLTADKVEKIIKELMGE